MYSAAGRPQVQSLADAVETRADRRQHESAGVSRRGQDAVYPHLGRGFSWKSWMIRVVIRGYTCINMVGEDEVAAEEMARNRMNIETVWSSKLQRSELRSCS